MLISREQNRIIQSREKIIQVVAAAGSGKTRTIVELVKHTINHANSRILLLSFSRKACGEIRERLGSAEKLVEVSTFHSFAYRHLKQMRPDLANQRVLSDEEKLDFLRERLVESDTAGIPYPLLLSNKSLFRKSLPGLCMESFRALAHYKREQGLLEFDDWIFELLRELRKHKNHPIKNKYDMVLVDEFQDTDEKQLEFLKLLKFQRLIAVGDDYQSIYSFRGSDPSIFLQFQKHFPAAKRLFLSTNYRSLEPVIRCGNHVIQNSKGQIKKRVKSIRRGASSLRVYSVEIEFGHEWKLKSLGNFMEGRDSEYKILCRSNHRIFSWQRAGVPSQNLSTIHGAKGLEFPVVFLDLVAGWSAASGSRRLPSEEVRLAYVGLTRAENLLIILHRKHYRDHDAERLVMEMFRTQMRRVSLESLGEILIREREFRARESELR